MNIGLIGSGNVATHLGLALHNNGHRVVQVYSRNLTHAQALASQLQAQAIDSIEALDITLDIYIIAVKDGAISTIAAQLTAFNLQGTVVHTSGSTDIAVLSGVGQNTGVLYPLQTFSKAQTIDFKKVPLLLEASNPHVLAQLDELAKGLSPHIYHYSSAQRRSLHLAAVVACNFSNYLYSVANQYLNEQGVSFDLLKPLILETAQKVQQHAPITVQTGPAVRGDQAILDMHLNMLQQQPELQQLYQVLSEGIGKLHQQEI